jgi:elongation factor P
MKYSLPGAGCIAALSSYRMGWLSLKPETIMLEYNEVREHKIILYDGQPYEVLHSHVFRKQQRKPVNATKLKNLITGRVAEVSFASSDKVEEADIITRPVKYLYTNRGEVWACDPKDPSKRFALTEDVVGDKLKFIKQNTEIELIIFTNDDDEEQTIGLKVPIKVELKVTDAPPSIKGSTMTGGNKVVTVETGATVNVPLFINTGETIRINTETGEYVERA